MTKQVQELRSGAVKGTVTGRAHVHSFVLSVLSLHGGWDSRGLERSDKFDTS